MRAVISLLLLAGAGTAAAQTLPALSVAADDADGRIDESEDAVFVISITEAVTQPLVVPLMVDANAYLFADPMNPSLPTSVTIPAGSSSVTLIIALEDDERYEPGDVITVTISNPDPASYSLRNSRTGVEVLADFTDSRPRVNVEVLSNAGEGHPMRFLVSLNKESDAPETLIDYQTSDGTATAGSDYTATSGRLTFLPRETRKTVEVTTLTDNVMDAGETLSLVLSIPTNANLGTTTATGTILELPVLSVAADDADGTLTEAETAVFTIAIVGPEAQARTQALAVPLTVTGTGNVLASGQPASVPIPAGSSSVKLTIALDNDSRDEADSVITVAISSPDDTMYLLGTSSAMLTVTDDDNAPTFSVAAARATEGRPLLFVVSLSAASERIISVDYTTADGEATAGEDYTTTTGILTFAANETEKIATVTTMRDEVEDPDETLSLVLSNADNANFAMSETSVTITGTITEGLNDEDVRALNEAILPYVASAISDATSQAVRDRAKAALGGRQPGGIFVRGASISQFLVSQARRGSDPTLFGRGEFNRGQAPGMRHASLEQWQAQADGRSSAAQSIPRLGIGDLDFTLALSGQGRQGAGEGDLNLWGRGFYTDLSSDEGAVSFDGSVTGGMIGIDMLRSGWLLGLSLNRAQADVDWDYNDFTGNHETTLTGFHPYIAKQWGKGTEFWATLGYDQGDAEITDDKSPDLCDACKFDVVMTSVALGVSSPLYEKGATKINLIADGAYSSMEAETQNPVTRETGWLRVGAELDYERALSDKNTFGSGVELTWRNDFGDGRSGNGVELGGSLELNMPAQGLRFDFDVRALLTHSDDADQWGISGGVSWAARQGGKGLSLAFKPQWGAVASARQALWEQGLTNDFSPRQGEDVGGRYSLELRYGLPVLQGQELLSLFARNQFKAAGQDLSLGADFNLGQHFSSGYELLMRSSGTAAERPSAAEHRGFIRYQRSF